MSLLELGQFAKGVVADFKVMIRSKSEPDFPTPNMTPNDEMILKGKSYSSESEKERLLSGGEKGNTKKKYNTSPSFSQRFEEAKESTKSRLKKLLPSNKEAKYAEISDKNAEKIAYNSKVETKLSTGQSAHLEGMSHSLTTEEGYVQTRTQELKALIDSKAFNKTELKQARELLSNAKTLDEARAGLRNRIDSISSHEGFVQDKDLQKHLQEHQTMAQRWKEERIQFAESFNKRLDSEAVKAPKKEVAWKDELHPDTKRIIDASDRFRATRSKSPSLPAVSQHLRGESSALRLGRQIDKMNQQATERSIEAVKRLRKQKAKQNEIAKAVQKAYSDKENELLQQQINQKRELLVGKLKTAEQKFNPMREAEHMDRVADYQKTQNEMADLEKKLLDKYFKE